MTDHPMTRRDAARIAGVAGAAALVLSQAGPAGAAPGGPAKPYEIKPMPFEPKQIKGLSERLLVSHYENNYATAVKRLNAITAQLAELDYDKAPSFLVNGLKREELVAANSMMVHELYFAGLGETSKPAGALADALRRDFGSYDKWAAQFTAMGKALGGGSGWVLLTWSPRDRRLVNQWAADHTTMAAGCTPVLALDMFEHAYQMDYGAGVAGYVDAVMKAIKWTNAEAIYAKLAI